ncbi:cytochrome C, partial [Paraburkholderia sp. Se-20369]|nr:cytochrome C [Paraburkholderia sp. Se-20369]
AAYLAGQLHAWQHGTRPPGPMALMPHIAGKLSDADIDAVAAYYARTGTTPAVAATQRSTP